MTAAPVANVVREQPPQPDAKAQAEAAAIAGGKLKRGESLRQHLHVGGLVLFWFAIAVFLLATSDWLFNLLAPDKWHFLDANQETHIQSLLITALGSSIVTDYGRRMLRRADDD